MKYNFSNMTSRIAAMLMAAAATLGFTACSDQDMEEIHPSYPAKEAIGSWVSQPKVANAKGLTGSASFVETGEGATLDTVCNVVLIDSTGQRTFYYGGQCTYNPVVGMSTVTFDNSSAGAPALIYFARRNDVSQMTMQVFNLSTDDNGDYTVRTLAGTLTLLQTKGFDLTGTWWGEIGNENQDVLVAFSPMGEDDYLHGVCHLLFGDEFSTEDATYTWDQATGMGEIKHKGDDGVERTIVAISLNKQNQLVLTYGDKVYTMEPILM